MHKDKFAQLRNKAEQLLRQTKNATAIEVPIAEVENLLEELSIYHIELELQNQELHVSNARLETEKAKFERLYMQAPLAYFTLKYSGNIVEINYNAAKLLGLPIQQFRYTSIFPYIYHECKLGFIQKFKEFFNSDDTQHIELTLVNNKRELIFTKISAICYYDEDLKEKLCLCGIIDLTERKQIEVELDEYRYKLEKKVTEQTVELQQNKQYLQDILDNLPELVSYMDNDLYYRFVNKTYENFFKIKREDILGKKLIDIIGSQAFDKTKNYIQRALAGERVYYQADLMYKDNIKRSMEAWLIPYIVHDKVEGYHAFIQDITERRRVERELANYRQHLEKLVSDKSSQA